MMPQVFWKSLWNFSLEVARRSVKNSGINKKSVSSSRKNVGKRRFFMCYGRGSIRGGKHPQNDIRCVTCRGEEKKGVTWITHKFGGGEGSKGHKNRKERSQLQHEDMTGGNTVARKGRFEAISNNQLFCVWCLIKSWRFFPLDNIYLYNIYVYNKVSQLMGKKLALKYMYLGLFILRGVQSLLQTGAKNGCHYYQMLQMSEPCLTVVLLKARFLHTITNVRDI